VRYVIDSEISSQYQRGIDPSSPRESNHLARDLWPPIFRRFPGDGSGDG